MTDLLDRSADADPADPARERAAPDGASGSETGAAGSAGSPADQRARPTGERWLLAALLAGAGAIHVAMTPSHLGESAVEGTGFLVAAWVQLLLAVAVLLRPLTGRLLAAIGVTSVALVGAWAVSRTAGLPFGAHGGHAESVSIVDGATVGLEVAALVVVLALASGIGASAAKARGVVLVGAVGAVLLTTGAVASPAARDHASGSHGDHASGSEGGHAHGAEGEMAGHEGHDVTGTAQDPGFMALSNGHQHERGNDEPLTAEERVLLAQQLATTAELVERYPTIADAEAAGWRRAGPFSPGLGTHYGAPDISVSNGEMDPANMPTPMLVYDGLEQDAPIAGFMYNAYGTDGAPEGFAGPNDHWHYHESVCIVANPEGGIDTPFGADLEGVTEDMCTDVGGSWIENTGYMVHVWNAPGYDSPEGMFTELNPKIRCPDGSYDQIPIEDLGTRNTVCP
jgi:hypothetical protein